MAAAPYRLRISDFIADTLRGLHPDLKRKVRAALEALVHDPHSGKALRQELAGLWSWRVGGFRIVYRMSAGRMVDIVAVGPRAVIYEETYRRVKRACR